jgi:hypothetical protein
MVRSRRFRFSYRKGAEVQVFSAAQIRTAPPYGARVPLVWFDDMVEKNAAIVCGCWLSLPIRAL